MSLNGIMSSALSALQTNTAALRVISNNVANVNTTGYVRRVADTTTTSSAGEVSGVEISDITRVVDKYLEQETYTSLGTSSQYTTESSIYDRLNALLGQVGDGTSIASQLSDITSALATASQSPSSSTSQSSVLTALKNFASTISNLSSSLSSLQTSTDQQISTTVDSANTLLKQISDLNSQIRTETISGDDASGLCDQRDQALQSLAKLMDVRTTEQSDGTVKVTTTDGTTLVGDVYAQLSYSGGATGSGYSAIAMSYVNPQTGNTVGQTSELDSHLVSGTLKGLIEMRDGTMGDLQQELGNLSKTAANAFNSVSNNYTACPPSQTLSGRQTGLVSGDSLNFTGKTTVAVADSSGKLVSRVDIDFDAGTISVDGTQVSSFTSSTETVGGFTSLLNDALGSNGSASFTDGKLTVAATSSSNGIVVQDASTNPSSRGGADFSEFFGLNDIFQTAEPALSATGLSAGDSCGQSAGQDGKITLVLKNADGTTVKTGTATITSGMTIGDVVTALNSAMGGAVTFSLNSDGSLSSSRAAGYSGCDIVTASDTTDRGSTGVSLTGLFGIGTNVTASYASGFSVTDSLAASAERLPFAKALITASTAAGDTIAGSGDSTGAVALENVETATQTIAAAGALSARTASVSDYANSLYQDIATRSSTASSNKTTQSDRLTEAQSQQSSTEGVSLDEELANMVIYQQAYSASARLITAVNDLYSALLQIQ